MTKPQWIRHWREERIRQRAFRLPIDYKILNSILNELYNYYYLPKQEILINLVDRYKSKMPPEQANRFTKLIKSWEPSAKSRASQLLQGLVYSRNPFLEMKKSSESFAGSYVPVPLILKKDR